MRRFLQHNRWATGLVACLLLFATSGFSLSRMTCLEGGHTVLSFGQADDCCPQEAPADGPSFKADCCALTLAQLDRVHVVVSSSLDLDPLFLALDAAPLEVVEVRREVPGRWLDSRPPPMAGMDRLIALRVHRI